MEIKQNKNQIRITGNDVYLEPNDMTILEGVYRWVDSISLDVLIALDHNGNIKAASYSKNLHETSDDENIIAVDYDGLYKIIHYILPTKSWTDRANLQQDVYFYDNEKFYLRHNNVDEEIGIEDLLEQENLILGIETFFMMYFIKRCFTEVVKKILSAQKDCKTRNLENFKEQRDLMNMFINVIQYLTEFGKLLEAQLYIEKFFKCNTICNKPISEVTNYDCGCK